MLEELLTKSYEVYSKLNACNGCVNYITMDLLIVLLLYGKNKEKEYIYINLTIYLS